MEKFDFYNLGKKDVNDIYIAVESRMKEIEEKYGKDAAVQYSLGVAAEMGRFSKMKIEETKMNYDVHATTDFGVENTRNNSYFGGVGTDVQYDQDGEYREPRSIR